MRKPIARLRIAVGNPGWYDSLTNIHLTITKPEALVYEGQNTSNIKLGVAHKLIYIVEGSLDAVKQDVLEKDEVKTEPAKTKVEEKKEPVKAESKKEKDEEVREANKSEKEDNVEEKKKPTKKKATTKKKKEDVVEEK